MPSCVHCGAATELYAFDEPICLLCAEQADTSGREYPKPDGWGILGHPKLQGGRIDQGHEQEWKKPA
jgi:hypothetical protein